MTEKIYFGLKDLLFDHECDSWKEFEKMVVENTDGVAKVGYIGGSSETDFFKNEDLSEKKGIFLMTDDGVGSILYFPFTFMDFDNEINELGIFKN